jgi:competence protein ComEA
MNDDERRALWTGVLILFLASAIRFAWEVRPVPPLLPPDHAAYETLLPATEAAVAEEARRRTPLAPGEQLDPNQVDAVELARLPGVGPALADRIVAHREGVGWIPGLEALGTVPGIGPATLERLRPFLVFSPPPAGWSPPPGAGLAGGLGPGAEPVDLNAATQEVLETLPGIGPALARRIVEDRGARGPFASMEELTRVSGVGPALLERIRPLAVVR